MAKTGEQSSHLDIEKGLKYRSSTDSDEENLSFSDAQEHSWHSPTSGHEGPRASAASSHGIDGAEAKADAPALDDVEAGARPEAGKAERICRICHLGLEKAAAESGVPIVLGCSCKADLAAAHKQCAETWFKIRGNKICEICGSAACNVVDSDNAGAVDRQNEGSTTVAPSSQPTEFRSFLQGHRFLKILLACLVLAFVISWLFHLNIHSKYGKLGRESDKS